MKKITLLTSSGEHYIDSPSYYIDNSLEYFTYLYKIEDINGEIKCTRLKISEVDDFFTYEISSTSPNLCLAHPESNKLVWINAIAKMTEFVTKYL
tara:strand:+ start:12306 stop:12590 length:285 start_codon:yes stop_codon:yes gene_type:complete